MFQLRDSASPKPQYNANTASNPVCLTSLMRTLCSSCRPIVLARNADATAAAPLFCCGYQSQTAKNDACNWSPKGIKAHQLPTRLDSSGICIAEPQDWEGIEMGRAIEKFHELEANNPTSASHVTGPLHLQAPSIGIQ